MADFSVIDRYLEDNRQSHLDQLFELLRIPSISADPTHRADMTKAGDWVANQFRQMGLTTEVIPGDGPSLIFASTPPVPNAPVILVYGHYDVQPCDPLNLWQSPPFEPEIRNGNIYARGSTDDKGQMLTHVQSLAAWLSTGQKLPLQVKYLIEGEEEKGSEVLEHALPKLRDKLACDAIVISDSSQYAVGKPAITYGLRGIAYFELRVHGPKVDLHSGTFGGAVTNPAIALARILTDIKNEDGVIQLPGFYDSVKPLSEEERAMWRSLNFSDDAFMKQLGVPGLSGEKGYTTLERRWARPTFDVHGLLGGYQGEGGKTVLPAWAGAKISFRLVPDQDPKTVGQQLRSFIASHTPVGVTVEVIDLHGGEGVVVDPNSRFMKGAVRAVEEGFDKTPVLIREGGSIPIVAQMVKALNCDVLLMGWGLDDDGAHSPNEKFCEADYYRGIRASSRLWQYLAE
jgi:acetylornithine deacetylase/succinyl-diaminopimelate desuccinylase-like protein